MEQVEGQIAQLTARMEQVEGRMAQLTSRMERVEEQIASLVEVGKRHTRDLAQPCGWYLEIRMRDRAPAICGRWMDETRVVHPTEIRKLVRGTLSRDELQRLLEADPIVTGVLDDHPELATIWLVVEVSTTVDRNDVKRALGRAALLRRLFPRVIPVVAGKRSPMGSER